MMSIEQLIETNFRTVKPNDTLRELTNAISRSSRNLYPVVDDENNFLGVVFFDHIKHIVFKPEFYDTTLIKDLSFYPDATVELSDSMEHVVKKFHETGNFNLPVLDKGKYVGFVSRANTFSVYRKKLKYFSED
jgi:CIC family chloride channel protein